MTFRAFLIVQKDEVSNIITTTKIRPISPPFIFELPRASKMTGRLEGQVAIITGGASGFGKATAEKFIKEGAKVLITDLNEASGQTAAKELGENCIFTQANVVSRSDWDRVLKLAVDTFGELTTVINNAGATYPNKATLDVTETDFNLCVDVNMKAVYHSVCTVVPYLQKRGKGGCFVNIASTAGVRPRPGLTWYNASKAACITATKTMAVEYAPDQIRFNAVCPVFASGTGMTHLFLGKPDIEENRGGFLASIPLGRACKPSDIANACCFLASEEATFVTGLQMEIDGGRCV
ncbi:hypothetical protein LTS15_004612 [Exophiala xenobiotica]|nr:hypothetical protein LTS15_004612 [Exophiala xenobiotica]